MAGLDRLPPRFVLAVAALLSACGASPGQPDPPVAPPPPAAPLHGAASITAAGLQAHVEVLADDAFEGRATMTPGAEKARAYLAARFSDYGLSPLPGRDALSIPYTLHEHGYDREATRVKLHAGDQRRALEAGVDFAPLSLSSSHAADATLVFAGYGIVDPDLGHDDYEGLDVEGKVVVVLRYTPDYGADDARFDRNQALFQVKARTAHARGAAGMIVVTGPRHTEATDNLRLATRLTLPDPDAPDAPDAGAPAPSPPAAEPDPDDRPFLAVHASRDAVDWLFRTAAGTGLAEVEQRTDAGVAPRDLRLAARAHVSVRRAEAPRPVTPANVVGFLPGSDPALAGEWIVIGGHYDHLGSFDGPGDTIYNGADDNASGTAGVLELARAFAALPERPARSLVFIGFSGEELGLLGSRAMLAEGQLPLERVVFMLNLDMIGRNPERPIALFGDGFSTSLGAIAEAANAAIGLDLELGGTSYSGASDHHPFYLNDIPFGFFFTGTHDDYHQLSDHADKLDYARMERIVRLAYGIVSGLAEGARPRFVHHISWLGATAQVVDGDGAVLTAVEDGTRAARAGLRVGDVVRGVDGPLEEPEAVGRRFRAIDPGATFLLELERAGAPVAIELERSRPGYLGVWPRDVSEEMRAEHGLGEGEGVLITRVVADGPAAQAGFEDGDILIRIAGVPVGARDLGRHLARIGAGEKVEVLVIRAGERTPLTMVLGERPRGR